MIALTLLLALGACSDPRLDTPEGALRVFISAARRADVVEMHRVYALELTGSAWSSGPVDIQLVRIRKKAVLDSAAAARSNAAGFVPAVRDGDVEIEADLTMGSRSETATYSLRTFDGCWRLYAHYVTGAP